MRKLNLLLLSLLFAFTAVANNLSSSEGESSCQAPTNVKVTIQENDFGYSFKYKAIITWDAAEGAEGYTVYVKGGSNSDFQELGTTNTCMYYAGSNNEGTLDFKVASICFSGDYSDYSETVTAFIGTQNDCPAPENFNVNVEDNGGNYAMTFTWDAVAGAESYTLIVGEEEFETTETTLVYETSEKKIYEVYLSTSCAEGPSNQSYLSIDLTNGEDGNEGDETGIGCVTPENLNVLVEHDIPGYEYFYRLTFSWDPVENSNLLRYKVFTDTTLFTETTNTVAIGGLPEDYTGTIFDVQIQSICGSDFTEILEVPIQAGTVTATNKTSTAGCPIPENFTVTVEENVPDFDKMFKLTFRWDPVPDVSNYKLFINGQLWAITESTEWVEGLNESVAGIVMQCAVMTECASEISEILSVKVDKVSLEEYENQFDVYPNPVNDRLVIETNEDVKAVSIHNILGVTVYRTDSFTDNEINVSDLTEGVYFINIETDRGKVVKKFIKK